MARGWESKSVESQKEDAGSGADRGADLIPEERELRRQRASLDLSRRRVRQEIATTRSAVRRTALEQTLAFLEAEIEKLGG